MIDVLDTGHKAGNKDVAMIKTGNLISKAMAL